MERKAAIRVISEQRCPGLGAERSELRAEGTLTRANDGWHLCYDESAGDMGGTRTSLHIGGGRVTLRRSGAVRGKMVFATGERHTTVYELDLGSLPLDILTERIDVQFDADGGTVELCYRIAAQGQVVSDNRLLLEAVCDASAPL